MDLDWMMLADYAQAPSGAGKIYITGGGVDTVTVQAPPPEGAPPGVVTVANVYLAARLLFHVTELGRELALEITIMDEDGQVIGKIEGTFTPEQHLDLPPAWPHSVHLVFPLVGMPIGRFGLFTINLLVDGNHLGDTSFRVVQGYD